MSCINLLFTYSLTLFRSFSVYDFAKTSCLACSQLLKLLLAFQDTVATCKARFGGLIDVKVLLQNSSDMCLLKLSNWMASGKLVAHSKGHLLKQCKHR